MLGRTHRILIGVVVAGAVVIAGIGFAGSYAAVRELAEKKGFGGFSVVFPIGIDAGICVLLALDLLLTWIRIPFPLLRQTAWLLTAATIAFNGAAAWPDPLGVGMHAVIPVLFVVAVEAARHAVGRIADITADKHMEGVRLTRWLLSPVPTFKLWRRMKLWELRSYEQVIKLEQDRLIYQARLQARFGRSWRRKAPVESLMPLRLARFGVPLAETAPAGLAAAGIEPASLPLRSQPRTADEVEVEWGEREDTTPSPAQHPPLSLSKDPADSQPAGGSARLDTHGPRSVPAPRAEGAQRQAPHVDSANADMAAIEQTYADDTEDTGHGGEDQPAASPWFSAQTRPTAQLEDEQYYFAYCAYVAELGDYPNARQFGLFLLDVYGVTGRGGGPLDEQTLAPLLPGLQQRYQQDLHAETARLEQDELLPPDSGHVLDEAAGVPAPRPAAEPEVQHPAASGRLEEQHEPDAGDGPPPHEPAPHQEQPTAVDRYYLGYESFLHSHGREPSREELAAHLAEQGITNPQGRPVKAAAVGRYQLEFRTYAVWAEMYEASDTEPGLDALLAEVDGRGIRGLHNKPITTEWMAGRIDDFRRRRQAIAPSLVDWSSVTG
ncbi:DUF2637 domain-containing protein [Streptomyces sp. NPDC046925]|uniref:DUF2637 domain-containing protein n=1 Tax=Streptomyces sp. NPDC046925 TaxID=3155375 RepID=UPI0033C5617A